VAAHTNADDATRYRDSAEVDAWLDRDPLRRLETYLRGPKLVDDGDLERFGAEAERFAAEVRTAMSGDMTADPAELFAHVYAEPTPALAAQREFLFAELAGRPS